MIKVFIIAAETADGFIAKDNHHSPFLWTSKEDKKRFIDLTKRAGVVVMGATTFKTLPQPMKERVNIVYSKSQTFEGAETTQDSPIDLIRKLETRGFSEVAICGGSSIYTMFLKAGVVDEVYLTIEPVLFGAGMHLLSDDINVQLKLEESHTTENGTIFSKYEVLNQII